MFFSESGVVLPYHDVDLGGPGCSSWLVGVFSKSGVVLPHGDGDVGG